MAKNRTPDHASESPTQFGKEGRFVRAELVDVAHLVISFNLPSDHQKDDGCSLDGSDLALLRDALDAFARKHRGGRVTINLYGIGRLPTGTFGLLCERHEKMGLHIGFINAVPDIQKYHWYNMFTVMQAGAIEHTLDLHSNKEYPPGTPFLLPASGPTAARDDETLQSVS